MSAAPLADAPPAVRPLRDLVKTEPHVIQVLWVDFRDPETQQKGRIRVTYSRNGFLGYTLECSPTVTAEALRGLLIAALDTLDYLPDTGTPADVLKALNDA